MHWLSILVDRPILAVVPAVLFLSFYRATRRPVVLVAGFAWLGYAVYEYAMKLRILCSGECDIRVDLLLLYPALALLSVVAAVTAALHLAGRRRTGPR
jgi:hypothetical protein